jgi:UTP:GlnB (protein PII) uridylyltransferase
MSYKQPNQAYTVDIHTLYGLQDLTATQEYNQLDNNSKLITVISVLFHDISKPSGVNDRKHPENGALIVKDIAKRLDFSENDVNRISNLVEFHQWFEMVCKDEISLDKLASIFKDNPSDVTNILIPFADADLRAIGPDNFYIINGKENFYNKLKPSLEEKSEKLQELL